MITESVRVSGYDSVYKFTDDDFHAIIAIHSTARGPALGGCRLYKYASNEAALQDALYLAKGMTYKNAVVGLAYGGGKAVINAKPPATREMMLKFGDAVEQLGGCFITGEDVGTTVADLTIAAERTSYLSGEIDPSPWTAIGVSSSIHAAIKKSRFVDYPHAMHVWVQGLGKVGWALADMLYNDGFVLHVSDIDKDKVEKACKKLSAHPYNPQTSIVQIYAPCAMGQVITPSNVDKIYFPIICGSANNQLLNDDIELAKTLQQNDVLYCPDFLVNSGGVLSIAMNFDGRVSEISEEVQGVGSILEDLIETANKVGKTPLEIAKRLAETRIGM